MSDIEELKKLLKENLEISKKIYKNTEKIKRHFFWTKIFKSIKFTIIIGLLLAGIFYSKPYLQEAFGFYRTVYQGLFSPSNSQIPESQINLDPATIKQLQKALQTIPGK